MFSIILIIISLVYSTFWQVITIFCCKKKKIQEIYELQDKHPELMNAIPIKSIYKNYIFRKLNYLNFTKLNNNYSFLNDYYVEGIDYERKHLLRRLKELTKEQYVGIEKDFDSKLKIYIKKLKEDEFPIIKTGHSYNLGTLQEFESYSYVYLLNNECNDFYLQEEINKDIIKEYNDFKLKQK